MTTNQTIDGVPRELLENCASYMEGSASGTVRIWHDRLRDLLDAESAPCAKSQVEPATQPQGEPVAKSKPVAKLHAERLTGRDGEYGITVEDSQWFNTCRLTGGEFYLYAEQPAPVAVVLPVRPRADEEEYERMTDYEKGLLHGGIELWDKIGNALNTK